MFGHLISHIYVYVAHQFHEWDHKVTAGIGVGVGLATIPFGTIFDYGLRLLGAISIVVAIVCSIRRENRETREYEAKRAKASQGEGEAQGTTRSPGYPGDEARPSD